jgi:hypothetical protein
MSVRKCIVCGAVAADECLNCGSLPTVVSRQRIAALAAENKRLRGALTALVRINEEHNAAMEAVMGRPLGWKDSYLDEARAALDTVRNDNV